MLLVLLVAIELALLGRLREPLDIMLCLGSSEPLLLLERQWSKHAHRQLLLALDPALAVFGEARDRQERRLEGNATLDAWTLGDRSIGVGSAAERSSNDRARQHCERHVHLGIGRGFNLCADGTSHVAQRCSAGAAVVAAGGSWALVFVLWKGRDHECSRGETREVVVE